MVILMIRANAPASACCKNPYIMSAITEFKATNMTIKRCGLLFKYSLLSLIYIMCIFDIFNVLQYWLMEFFFVLFQKSRKSDLVYSK